MSHTTFKESTDEQIVEKIIAEGQTNLFEFLYKKYHGKVLDKCNGLLKNRTLAADFTTDILTKAFEKLQGFKGNSSFSSWLYAITYNYCIDYLREKKKLHYPEWNQQNELPEIVDEVIDNELTDLHFARLSKLMNLLHTEEKAMLLMKYQDDISIKDIAIAMRLSEGAVKMRIKRSKARILYLYKTLYND